jgi:hypothetical protein
MLHETLLTKSDNLKNKLERIYYWFTHVQLVKYKHNILNRRITHRVSTMIQILTTNIYSFYLQVLEKVLLVLSALAREARQLLKDQNSTWGEKSEKKIICNQIYMRQIETVRGERYEHQTFKLSAEGLGGLNLCYYRWQRNYFSIKLMGIQWWMPCMLVHQLMKDQKIHGLLGWRKAASCA